MVTPGPASKELDRIAAELKRMHNGSPWHGPGVKQVLRDVTAAQASARIVPGVHTIYSLTHHIAAWLGEVSSRLAGNRHGNPADGNFPRRKVVDTVRWRETLERLGRRHAELLEAIAAFDPNRLEDPVDPSRKKASGRTVTFYVMLHGIVQHNAYHAGQIMLLRRALEQDRGR